MSFVLSLHREKGENEIMFMEKIIWLELLQIFVISQIKPTQMCLDCSAIFVATHVICATTFMKHNSVHCIRELYFEVLSPLKNGNNDIA